VLITALFTTEGTHITGNEALILLAVHQGLIRPCISEKDAARLQKLILDRKPMTNALGIGRSTGAGGGAEVKPPG
jgi:hypothetical protein